MTYPAAKARRAAEVEGAGIHLRLTKIIEQQRVFNVPTRCIERPNQIERVITQPSPAILESVRENAHSHVQSLTTGAIRSGAGSQGNSNRMPSCPDTSNTAPSTRVCAVNA